MPQRPPRHVQAWERVERRAIARQRGSSTALGYDRAWQRFRAWMLHVRPLCQDCAATGLTVAASEVHHVAKIRDRPDLRLDPTNVMCLCEACHSTRTARGE
jgi:5-methylcytosine-specific restriction protein A